MPLHKGCLLRIVNTFADELQNNMIEKILNCQITRTALDLSNTWKIPEVKTVELTSKAVGSNPKISNESRH